MRIGYAITQYWPALSGAAIHTRHLARLMANHHDVTVVAQLNSNTENPYSASMKPTQYSHSYTDGPVSVNIAAPQPLEAPLLKACAIMTGSRRTREFGLQLYTRLLERRLTTSLANRDVIHCVNATMEHLAVSAARCAIHLKRPFVLTPLFRPEDSGSAEALRGPLEVADAVIAQTNVESELLKRSGVPADKIHVVSVGPIVTRDADAHGFRRRHGIKGNLVLFMARKERSKGYEHILHAAGHVWNELPDTYFVFAGPRTEESSRIFSRWQDQRVVELGELEPWSNEKSSALAACDVFCMPSAPECSGIVFLEAWSFGKPVIAADIPTEREFVNHGVDGLLVERDSQEIARALLALLRNAQLRRKMGEAGRIKVKEHYSWERVVESMNRIYEDVGNRRSRETA